MLPLLSFLLLLFYIRLLLFCTDCMNNSEGNASPTGFFIDRVKLRSVHDKSNQRIQPAGTIHTHTHIYIFVCILHILALTVFNLR